MKKNSTLPIGHSSHIVYTNPIKLLKHFTLRMQNDNWMQVACPNCGNKGEFAFAFLTVDEFCPLFENARGEI